MDACREMNTVRKAFSDMPKRLLSIVLVLLGINQTGFGLPENVPPGRAFSIGIEMPCQVPVTPAVENALRDIGIQIDSREIYLEDNSCNIDIGYSGQDSITFPTL